MLTYARSLWKTYLLYLRSQVCRIITLERGMRIIRRLGTFSHRMSAVGYQGLEGNHSHAALSQHSFSSTPFPSLFELFSALESNSVSKICIPAENSITGKLNTLSLLAKFNYCIVGQIEAIEQHYISTLPQSSLSNVQTIYIHPYGMHN